MAKVYLRAILFEQTASQMVEKAKELNARLQFETNWDKVWEEWQTFYKQYEATFDDLRLLKDTARDEVCAAHRLLDV